MAQSRATLSWRRSLQWVREAGRPVKRLLGRDMTQLRDDWTYRPLLRKIDGLSMVPTDDLCFLARVVKHVLAHDVPGAFVECGTWRGGAAFFMALLLREAGVYNRQVWLCDSFQGLPPPGSLDGALARQWTADSAAGCDNCSVSLEEVRRSAARLGLTPYTRFVPGWFDETLANVRAEMGAIALLRIDADWYDSVKCCLDNLYDQVAPGGVVLFDDYYVWAGCAVAVNEFLGTRKLPHRIQQAPQSAFFIKDGEDDPRWAGPTAIAPASWGA
jgi:O-methyltransferase